MKTARLLAFVCSFSFASIALADTQVFGSRKSEHPINVRLNPLAFLFSTVNGSADYSLNPKVSVGADFGVTKGRKIELPEQTFSESSYEVGAKATYYFADVYRDSFYTSAGLAYGFGDVSFSHLKEQAELHYTRVSSSLVGGYRWLWDNGVDFRIGLGALQPLGVAINGKTTSGFIEKVDEFKSNSLSPQLNGEFALGVMI